MMITKEETIKKRLTSRFKGLGALMLALILAVLPTPLLPAGHVEAAEGDNYYLIANIQSNVLLCSGQESIDGAKVYDEMTLSSNTNTNKYVEIPSGDNKLGLKEGSPLSIEGSFYYGNYEFQITVENDVTLYVGSVCESDPDADPPYNNLAFYSGASIQVKLNGTVVAENTELYDEGKVSCQLPAGKYKVVNTPVLVGDYLSYPRCKNVIDFETIGTVEKSESTGVVETSESTGAVEGSVSAESYKDPGYPLYRLYNKRTGEHFFTMSEVERNYWLDRSAETGWTDENIAWYVSTDTGIPVYRVFDAKRTGQHRFTADVNERDEYLKKGWVDEGIGWYSSGSEGKEIYKLKHPTAKNHYYHYTIYEEERDTLLAQGWTLEESGFTGQ